MTEVTGDHKKQLTLRYASTITLQFCVPNRVGDTEDMGNEWRVCNDEIEG